MQKELKNRQEFYDWYKDNDFINFTEYDTFPYIDFEEEWNQKYENDEMEYVDEDYVSEAFENSTEEAFKKGKLTYPEFFDIFTSWIVRTSHKLSIFASPDNQFSTTFWT